LTTATRVLPVGDAAASVELGDRVDPALNARVRALDRALAEAPVAGQLETVPGHASLLVLFEPGRKSWPERRDELLARAEAAGAELFEAGVLRVVPTRYGGDDGPDLAWTAARAGLSAEELVRLHSGTEYTALMLGFMPGFAYLGTLAAGLETPRLETPRVRVPAGSVAIAARQTGVYPADSPGGWRLLGRTSLRVFDPWRDPPALIQPGDRVRFVPSEELPPPPPAHALRPEGAPVLEVLEPGLLTTVQDLGRPGLRRLGVSWVGALDQPAARAANELVGNDAGDALLECTLGGPRLRFLSATHFAVTGADLDAVLRREDLGAWRVPLGLRVFARAGNELFFETRRAGCRAYVAIAGGIAVPLVLASRATDLGGGFGGHAGRALKAGDRLGAGAARNRPPTLGRWSPPEASLGPVRLRVVLGPQQDRLHPASLERFVSEAYAVAPASNRVGCRLVGARLEHRGGAEIPSEGMVPGSIQVPPDGQPIVMLADGPTTGGYAKAATVVRADLPRLAQLVPGMDSVRFEAVGADPAT
jgi:KipI family sensor histidine kinase inhibitor